ncbi:MAG: hypothetical protein K9J12_12495 [Melioribacteraceae bacterium]|nr:hypothetical protein [Melioribacteraceae bacterium]MCF8414527.1 hypothetical protein [Melioribacteraceae bacterium]MCF8430535.1 hypothetical protein [Melioribacteraceae bacterium]
MAEKEEKFVTLNLSQDQKHLFLKIDAEWIKQFHFTYLTPIVFQIENGKIIISIDRKSLEAQSDLYNYDMDRENTCLSE